MATVNNQLSENAQQSAPYSQEAEEAVLGAILVNPDAFISVAAILKAEDFFFLKHGYVWQALERIVKRDEPIEYLVVMSELKAMGWLDEIGGAPFITLLVNNTPTSLHAETYARLVQRAAIRRRFMVAADEIKALAVNEKLTLEQMRDKAQKQFLRVSGQVNQHQGETIGEGINRIFEDVEKRFLEGDKLLGVPSGLTDLDNLLGGFEKQDLIVLAGRPGMGKSALVLRVALNAAQAGYKIGLFPNEMSKDECYFRMAAMITGLNSQRIKRPATLSPAEYSRLTSAFGELAKLPIFIDDARMSPAQLYAVGEWRKHNFGLDMIMVDGMYRMPSSSGTTDRYERFSEVAEDLKNACRDLDLPIFTTHQLNRELERRADKRPVLSDLAESGRIEWEIDIAMFLYRDAVYNPATEFPNEAEIITAKNRDGSTGTVSVYFDRQVTNFLNGQRRTIHLNGLSNGEATNGDDHPF